MSITLITYNGQTVTPKSDAIFHDSVQRSGIFRGCGITYIGSNRLQVAAGYGIIKGRQFEIDQEELTASMPASGTLKGRVYIHMDLGAETPIEIRVVTAATLPALVTEEDCNYTNGIYDLELATFTASATDITELTDVSQQILPGGSSALRRIVLPSTGWSSSTVTIDGGVYHTQTVTVNEIYSESPIISIGAAGTLPTEVEEAAYAMINAATADVDNAQITFYAKEVPETQVIVIAKEVS